MSWPCPSYPVKDRRQLPIDAVDVEDGGALFAEQAQRRDSRIIELAFDRLTETEAQQLLGEWNDGLGTVTPFSFTVPGDGAAKTFVFADDSFSIAYRTGAERSAIVRLLDVTPPA